MSRTLVVVTLLGILVSAGCADELEPGTGEDTALSMAAIIDGSEATDYPEAAYLDIDPTETTMYVCSGVLVSPSVVLTAGHCVDGHAEWNVHVAGAFRVATRSAVYDWYEGGSASVNPAHHDLGLVFLDAPIQIPRFPMLRRTALPDDSDVTCVGRVDDGSVTSTMYQQNVQVTSGDQVGYPFDYTSAMVIQGGDSGGPVFRDGSHEIVAVNSAVGRDLQVLARVDLLATWIALQVAAEDVRLRLSNPRPSAVGGGELVADGDAPCAERSGVQRSIAYSSTREAVSSY